MPRTIVTEDGSQIEVPTEEELSALQTKAKLADETSKKAADLQAEIDKINSDPATKNWKQLRETTDKLKAELAKQGKQVDDNGNITEAPKAITGEEIEAKATRAAEQVILNNQKNTALNKFDPEKRKVVEHFFNKLTTGETVTADNIDKFIEQAHLLADPQAGRQNNTKTFSANGQPPVFKPQTPNNFSESDQGKALANEVFGPLSYGKDKK